AAPRFLPLAAARLHVRQERRARKRRGQRPPALDAPAVADVADNRAREPDRVDPGMMIEAPILDRDHGVLQVRRDVVELDVVPLFVEAEPGLAIGAVEDRVTDPA